MRSTAATWEKYDDAGGGPSVLLNPKVVVRSLLGSHARRFREGSAAATAKVP